MNPTAPLVAQAAPVLDAADRLGRATPSVLLAAATCGLIYVAVFLARRWAASMDARREDAVRYASDLAEVKDARRADAVEWGREITAMHNAHATALAAAAAEHNDAMAAERARHDAALAAERTLTTGRLDAFTAFAANLGDAVTELRQERNSYIADRGGTPAAGSPSGVIQKGPRR